MEIQKRNTWFKCLFTLLLIVIWNNACAQRLGVTTNLLSWATLSPNIGMELCVSHKSSLAFGLTATPWKISDRLSLRQISITPEYRYWFKQVLYGHYIGINMLYSAYDFRFRRKKYDGNLIALGLGYGYSFLLSERLSIIPGIGFGLGYDHSRISSVRSGFKPVITKATITLQYVLR
ncbi:MAG: DUF3575 domain-containing protein [Bacteroidales bacterium]